MTSATATTTFTTTAGEEVAFAATGGPADTVERALLRLLTAWPNRPITVHDIEGELGRTVTRQAASHAAGRLRRDLPILPLRGVGGYVLLTPVPQPDPETMAACESCATCERGICGRSGRGVAPRQWCFAWNEAGESVRVKERASYQAAHA